MLFCRLCLLSSLALASCSKPAATSAPSQVPASDASAQPESKPESTDDGISPADQTILQRGVAALEAGDHEGARLIFAGMLDRYPKHPELTRLHERAVAEAAKQAEREAAMQPKAIGAVAFRRQEIRTAPVTQGTQPRLVEVSKQRNGITDDAAWFEDNGLRLPTWSVPNPSMRESGEVPAWIPTKFDGLPIVRAIDDGEHAIAIYGESFSVGRLLFVFDAQRELVAAYDFLAWTGTSEPGGPALTDRHLVWALVRDGVLFVASKHHGYARDAGGRTAYITALDLRDGSLLWRSRPLVSNARNFLYRDGYLISGYGFTAEPDFLFVLDAATGKTLQKTKLRKGPTYILEKEGQVFVRTYDTDYVFEIR